MEFQVILYFLSFFHVSIGFPYFLGPCLSSTGNKSEIALTNYRVIGAIKHSEEFRSKLDQSGTKKPCTLKVVVRNINNCSELIPDCPLDQGFLVKHKNPDKVSLEEFVREGDKPTVQVIGTSPKSYQAKIVWPCENITELYFDDIGFLVVCETEECEDLLQNKSIVETKRSVEMYVRSNYYFSEVAWENEGAFQNLCVREVKRNALKNRNRFIFIPIIIIMIIVLLFIISKTFARNNRIYPMS